MASAMSEAGISNGRKPHNNSSWGLINERHFASKTMLLHAVENSKARKRLQRKNKITNLKRRKIEHDEEKLDIARAVKKKKLCSEHTDNLKQESETSTLNSEDSWMHESNFVLPLSSPVKVSPTSGLRYTQVPNQQHTLNKRHLPAALGECWEVDSGFSSEASPPASGRSSPYNSSCQGMVVAMDCEMVGTGPGGRCSELARCSLLDYHGNVIYDKYIRPCQPVTDYRTRWSGIRKHHLQNALPFSEARAEILEIIQGKVVVGHALNNDFQALDFNHPCHMKRDTSSTRLLRQLAGYPVRHCISLKILANKLLDREIQVGRRGHCSVEDARAALDLYKLVEKDWEQNFPDKLMDKGPSGPLDPANSSQYMQDQYWPENLVEDSQ
ncbi:apoptosis-enhancing nuclease [Osmerus eperlanus]|uniref:apoptosis-enhancing nuclease n=1 Tax=Osmerus eperlanus TaxID=29151 RepID=UPI002E126DFA